MRLGLVERYRRRSFIFVMTMIIGINMLIYVLLFTMDRFLMGDYLLALITLAIILFIFSIPYYIVWRRHRTLRRKSVVFLDDLFLAAVSFAFTIVGTVLMSGVYLLGIF